MHLRIGIFWLAVAVAILGAAAPGHAHGMAGKRFFPATLVIEDPFAADELSLPTVFHLKDPADAEMPATRETRISGEFSKRLSPNLGFTIGGTYKLLLPDGGNLTKGFDNMELGAKYVLLKSAKHEMLLSLGLDVDLGGTGTRRVGSEGFTTFTPTLFFGKGLGDLPDSLEWLRPLAVTGSFGGTIPTRSQNKTFRITDEGLEIEREPNPNVIKWGFTVQYNLQYLQSFVRDVGLPAPFNRMIPIVELAFETPVNGPVSGRTTGTVNPGLIWFGRYVQLGLEALIPINQRSGKIVGVVGQVHFYLDDIAPSIFSWTPFHGTLGPTQPR